MYKQTKWTIKFIPDPKYPEIGEYRIMEPNPDAGKSGVVYSGKELTAASTDSKENAARIVQAVNYHEELKDALKGIVDFWRENGLKNFDSDIATDVIALLRHIEDTELTSPIAK